MKTKSKITYNEAIERLDVIMSQINAGNVDIDKLSSLLSEAHELINFCRSRLYKVDEEVKKMIAEIDNDTPVS